MRTRHVLSVGAASIVLRAAAALAVMVPGGGNERSDCFAEFNVRGAQSASARAAECTDGDPACDADAVCGNASCTFRVAACLNQHDASLPACTPPGPGAALRKAVESGPRRKRVGLGFPFDLASSACGAFVDVVVPANASTRAVKMRVTGPGNPRRDSDIVRLSCAPRVGPCPTTTTTTTSTSTTTTTLLPRCGDGTVSGTEECDPPCAAAGCDAGELCNDQCACVPQTACTCGAPDPEFFKFTTDAFSDAAAGSVSPARCAQCPSGGCTNGTSCTTNADCPGGSCRGDLTSGGLYFGGGSLPQPVPAQLPDLNSAINRVCCSGSTLTLAPTSAGESAGTETVTAKTCTSAGCFFGAPVPILNGTALSTCVVNTFAHSARGTAECTTGEATLDAPLTSTIYLTGDHLNGQSPDQPNVPGIQPCPLCTDGTCKGGARAGLPCVPGTSALTEAYPTSVDCLPASGNIGALPVAFVLTTATVTKTASDPDGGGPQQRAFCAFCRDPDTFAYEGEATAGPARPCVSNADCTNAPYIVCQQRDDGAFGNIAATTITEIGVPPGDLTDRQSHAARLVSVFCVPPTYSGLVDPVAGLPGPGAVSLPGQAQLLP